MGLFGNKKSNGKPTIAHADSSLSINSNGSLKSPLTPKSMQSPNGAGPALDQRLPRAPDPTTNPAGYLRSIHSVRERNRVVYEQAKKNRLKHFNVDWSKFIETASYIVSIIKVCSFPACNTVIA
jgi:hypothetical protein